MIIADTDVLIDFLAGKDPGAGRVEEELQKGALYTTVISRFELLSGSKSMKQNEKVEQLLEALKILTLDVPAADRAAEIRRHLDQKGHGIGMADSLIAGIVVEHGAHLLTRNDRHFNRVQGLKLSQWG
ncbi:MAG TPA: type II toxin-antitoxin system VapC family toxin [bacterium]|jgi:tRNA(fMet)-specific endonuclease VapC|nr:type II toxin-antitoxin system VapC family toxin [bacterium]